MKTRILYFLIAMMAFHSDRAIARMTDSLRPLDILLSKNEAVSSRLIPGHFSHSAIYLGNEDQLKALGIWQTKFFENYRSDIQKGRVIIEAISPRVRLVSLEEYIVNNKEVLIIRKSDSLINPTLVSQAYERGLQQLFKPYDFMLNLGSRDKIFCAELVSLFYKNINWPIRYGFGIYSLKPDNFAEVVLHLNSKFRYVYYYNENSSLNTNEVDTSFIAKKIGYVWRDINGVNINDSQTQGYFWDRQVRPLGMRIIKRAVGIKTVIVKNPTSHEALTLYKASEVDTL